MRLVRNIFIRHGVNFSFRGLLQTPCLIPVNLSARQDRAEFDNAFYRTALRFLTIMSVDFTNRHNYTNNMYPVVFC